MRFLLAALLCVAAQAFGQVSSSPPLVGSKGTANPAACSVGQLFFRTDATAGQNLYLCTSANTWTQQAGTGNVTGAASSVDNAIVRFDGTGGKTIQDYTSNAPTCGDTGVCTFVAPILGTPTSVTLTNATSIPTAHCVAASDETTALTTGTAKVTFRMPYAMTLTAVRGSLGTAATGATLFQFDVNEAGVTIFSTEPTFDASEKTTTTAATAAVISDTALADDAEMTVDIVAVGNTIAGAGLKVCLVGRKN